MNVSALYDVAAIEGLLNTLNEAEHNELVHIGPSYPHVPSDGQVVQLTANILAHDDYRIYREASMLWEKPSQAEIDAAIAAQTVISCEYVTDGHKVELIAVTVSLDANGGTLPPDSSSELTVYCGKPYGALPTPTKLYPGSSTEQYEFLGWYYEGRLITSSSICKTSSTHMLTAQWKDPSSLFTMSYDLNGGTYSGQPSIPGRQILNGDVIPADALPSISRASDPDGTEYEFIGWFYNGTKLIGGSSKYTYNQNITIQAQWKVNIGVEIQFKLDPASRSVASRQLQTIDSENLPTYGDIFGTFPTIDRAAGSETNYIGWTDNNAPGTRQYRNGSAVNFYSETGEQIGEGTVLSEAGGIYERRPGEDDQLLMPKGSRFEGWYDGSDLITSLSTFSFSTDEYGNIMSTKQIVAHWSSDSVINVTLNANGGDDLDPDNPGQKPVYQFQPGDTYYSQLSDISTPTRTDADNNWEFKGWARPKTQTDHTSVLISSDTLVNEFDHEISAHWEIATLCCTITLSTDGGTTTLPSTFVVVCGQRYGSKLPTGSQITKTGYKFGGWYDSPSHSDEDQPITQDSICPLDAGANKTLYAYWIEIPTESKIKLDPGMGTSPVAFITGTKGQNLPFTAADLPVLPIGFEGFAQFQGYYDEANVQFIDAAGNGQIWTKDPPEDGNTYILSAHWNITKTSVFFDPQPGYGGTEQMTVAIGQTPSESIVLPNYDGHVLDKYVFNRQDGSTIDYVNENGQWTQAWNEQQLTATLSASWKKGPSVYEQIYPVGSLYITTESTTECPMKRMMPDSSWSLVAQNKTIWGYSTADHSGKSLGDDVVAGLPDVDGGVTISGLTASEDGAHTHTIEKAGMHSHGIQWDKSAGSFWYSIGERGTNTSDADVVNGPIKDAGEHTHTISTDGVHTHTIDSSNATFSFDDDNTIYGKSSTVQPPAMLVNIWKRTA